MVNQKEIDKIDKDGLLNLMDPVPTLQNDKIEIKLKYNKY